MPRIYWEEKPGLAITTKQRELVFEQLANVVAEEVTRFDPGFQINPDRHIAITRSELDPDDWIHNAVLVTITGSRRPDRIKNAKRIGDAIWKRLNPVQLGELGWALSCQWNEDYYRSS